MGKPEHERLKAAALPFLAVLTHRLHGICSLSKQVNLHAADNRFLQGHCCLHGFLVWGICGSSRSRLSGQRR